MINTISFKNRSVPVYYNPEQEQAFHKLPDKLHELEMDFEFRKRWKQIESVEMVRNVAILQYTDGTKLYLEVS